MSSASGFEFKAFYSLVLAQSNSAGWQMEDISSKFVCACYSIIYIQFEGCNFGVVRYGLVLSDRLSLVSFKVSRNLYSGFLCLLFPVFTSTCKL